MADETQFQGEDNPGYRYDERREYRDDREVSGHYREQRGKVTYGRRRGAGAVCCFMLVFLVLFGVSLAGLVLSVVEFAQGTGPSVAIDDRRPMPSEGYDDEQTSGEEYDYTEYEPGPYNADEVWLIQIGFDGSNLEYFDTLVGQLKGFDVDVVNAVCRKANKNCQIVVDSYSRCWSGGYGGDGLMSRWYHACTGWRVTTDRLLTYKFTDPFQQVIPAYLVTRSGSGQFNWRDLTGQTIGFLNVWYSDPACLNRQDSIEGLPLNEDQIVVYETSDELEAALENGEIDATFIGADVELVSRNNIASDEIQCLVEGAGMMMRKDTYLEKWWNPAWKAVLASNEYQDICDDIQRVHGDKPGLGKDLLCRNKYEDLPSYRKR